jgi:UTP--glucose-1-phosphate uridylyltransferase
MKRIRKAVLPVAGLGTRFLPATKSVPKEMLTVVDRPVIQHVVDEAKEAGIEHFIFVTGRNKGVIEDHFDMAYELDATLKSAARQRNTRHSSATCRRPARRASPASRRRSASATRSGARARSSATSPSP